MAFQYFIDGTIYPIYLFIPNEKINLHDPLIIKNDKEQKIIAELAPQIKEKLNEEIARINLSKGIKPKSKEEQEKEEREELERKELERKELERKEQKRKEQERKEQERKEQERKEQEQIR